MNEITPVKAKARWVLDFEAFEAITTNMGFKNDAQRAEALDMHHTSISKIRSKKVRPGRKFIEGTAQIGIPFSAIFIRETSD